MLAHCLGNVNSSPVGTISNPNSPRSDELSMNPYYVIHGMHLYSPCYLCAPRCGAIDMSKPSNAPPGLLHGHTTCLSRVTWFPITPFDDSLSQRSIRQTIFKSVFTVGVCIVRGDISRRAASHYPTPNNRNKLRHNESSFHADACRTSWTAVSSF